MTTDTTINLELSDLKDISSSSIRKMKRKDDSFAIYSQDDGLLVFKPIIAPKKTREIFHIDLIALPSFMTAKGAKVLFENINKKILFKQGRLFKIYYRLWDDSSNLNTSFEEEKFKIEIRTVLGGRQNIIQPIDFEAGADRLIEGDIFRIERDSSGINVKLVYTGKQAPYRINSFLFPGFRIRVYFDQLSRENILGYDEYNKYVSPE